MSTSGRRGGATTSTDHTSTRQWLVALALVAGCSHHSAAGPHSDEIVYRVVDSTQGTARTTTVTVDVQHPYASRTVTSGSGGYATDGEQAFLVAADGSLRAVAAVPPSFPAGALHLDVALASAARHGLAARVGEDEVLGRRCALWRSKAPLDGDPVTAATADSSTVTCVSEQGQLLRDVWTLHGRVVRTRTATRIGSGPALTFAVASPAASVGTAQGVKVVPRDVLLRALAVPEPARPAGLAPDRDAATITRDPTGEVSAEGGVLTWSDCCRRLVVLDVQRGLTHRLVAPADGVPVALRDGRAARLTVVGAGVRLTFAAGSFVVTVTADLPEDDVVAWASGLSLGQDSRRAS